MINLPMKKNVKKIIINIPSDQILKRITSTPALSSLLKNPSLVVGDNIEYVNHYTPFSHKTFWQLLPNRCYLLGGLSVGT